MVLKSLQLLAVFSSLLFSCSILSAQTLAQDTLAVRIMLDANGLVDIPASQVITISDSLQRVTALRMSGMRLVKITPEIGKLDSLQYLSLSNNLIDSLPVELWNLSRLATLDLGGNGLKEIDPGISKLKNLLLLGLRDNQLTTVPAGLDSLQLVTLLLSGNAIDTLPEGIANLLFLSYLDLSGNKLKTVPFTLAAMDRLDSLDLGDNALETLPELITEMKASTKVKLENNHLCNLSASLSAWADQKDPAWSASQTCDAVVRPYARAAGGAVRPIIWDGARFLFVRQGILRVTPGFDAADAMGRSRAGYRAPGLIRP